MTGEEMGAPASPRVGTYELAHRMQASTPDAVDLTSESKATLDLYGVDPAAPRSLNCLLARRLLQRGTRFVQLYHTDWDHHGDPNNHLGSPLEARAREVDRASAALVRDLESLGMLEDTLVVWGGEFGRTPLGEVRKKLGRDHHVEAFTLWMAGGGGQGRALARGDRWSASPRSAARTSTTSTRRCSTCSGWTTSA